MENREKVARRLREELEHVRAEIARLRQDSLTEEIQGGGDNTPLSESMDAAIATEDRELRIDVMSRLIDRAAALDEALHRNEAGTYGLCLECNQPIGEKRLELVPEAGLCRSCQDLREGSLGKGGRSAAASALR